MTRKYTMQISREEMTEYGEFFRSMRQSVGLNLEQMAEKLDLGIFRTSISKWEKGISVPQMDIDDIVQRYRNVVKQIKLT